MSRLDVGMPNSVVVVDLVPTTPPHKIQMFVHHVLRNTKSYVSIVSTRRNASAVFSVTDRLSVNALDPEAIQRLIRKYMPCIHRRARASITKLLLPFLLRLDDAIIVDDDTLFFKSIDDAWLDFDGPEDAFFGLVAEDSMVYNRMMGTLRRVGWNGGFNIANFSRIRSARAAFLRNLTAFSSRWCARPSARTPYHERFTFGDQTAFAYMNGRIHPLPCHWNIQVGSWTADGPSRNRGSLFDLRKRTRCNACRMIHFNHRSMKHCVNPRTLQTPCEVFKIRSCAAGLGNFLDKYKRTCCGAPSLVARDPRPTRAI